MIGSRLAAPLNRHTITIGKQTVRGDADMPVELGGQRDQEVIKDFLLAVIGPRKFRRANDGPTDVICAERLLESEPLDGNPSLGNENFQHRRFGFKHVCPERCKVESNGGLHIVQGFFIGVALTDNDAF